MRTLIYALLVCYAMVQGRKDRKGKAIQIGRNALPQRNKNSDKFDGFESYEEAKDWVKGKVERSYAEISKATFDDDLWDDLYGVLVDDATKFIVDGTIINGRSRVKSRLKIMLTLSHVTFMSDSDDIIFPNDKDHWGPYFVKYSFDVEGSRNPGYRYIMTITATFRKDGRVKEYIIKTPDGHLSALLEQAKRMASAAFKVTDFIGDIAKSVNMEDVYLQYVVYIFFVILFGMAIIVILLTAVCVKVVLLGENKNKYKQVPATDNEL